MPFIRDGIRIPGVGIPAIADGYEVVVGDFNENTGTEKAELVPTMCYGDGKPYDVGTDRILAGSLNAYHDGKSLHQAPAFFNGSATVSAFSGEYRLLFVQPIFLGMEFQGTAISRVLHVAPFFRSADGSSVSLRVTLTDQLPQVGPAASDSVGSNAVFTGHFSQATWTTSSTTFATHTDANLSLGCRDIFWGYGFLIVERSSDKCQCLGLGKVIESPRVVA